MNETAFDNAQSANLHECALSITKLKVIKSEQFVIPGKDKEQFESTQRKLPDSVATVTDYTSQGVDNEVYEIEYRITEFLNRAGIEYVSVEEAREERIQKLLKKRKAPVRLANLE